MKKMKRLVCLLLAVLTVFGMFATTASALTPVEKMVTIAKGYVGKYASDLGYSTNWCAYFATQCASEAGLSSRVPATGSCVTLIRNFLQSKRMYVASNCLQCKTWRDEFGNLTKNATKILPNFMPKKGDFVFFADKPSDVVAHVGIVVSVEKLGTCRVKLGVVEGNWCGGVALNYYTMNLPDCDINAYYKYIVGFGRP